MGRRVLAISKRLSTTTMADHDSSSSPSFFSPHRKYPFDQKAKITLTVIVLLFVVVLILSIHHDSSSPSFFSPHRKYPFGLKAKITLTVIVLLFVVVLILAIHHDSSPSFFLPHRKYPFNLKAKITLTATVLLFVAALNLAILDIYVTWHVRRRAMRLHRQAARQAAESSLSRQLRRWNT
ncbi:hypothetical protein U1Q18_024834 [Sarracenia purpurea var. burkii]